MMRVGSGCLGAALVWAAMGAGVWAQSAGRPEEGSVQTFYLVNLAPGNDANEIATAVRNMVPPEMKIYLVPSENALSVRGTPEQLAQVQKLLSELDRPKRSYKLTYTITEVDGGRRVGTQHFAVVLVLGGRTTLKQGSRIPVATGSYTAGSSATQTQVTYLDVGLNIDASLDELGSGARLRTKVEQSSIAEERSGLGAQDPIVRQTTLEGTALLTAGKPVLLGSLDVPGSTRHLDVEVAMEAVK